MKAVKALGIFMSLLVLLGCSHENESLNSGNDEKDLKHYPLANDNISKYNNINLDKNNIPILKYKDKYIYYPVQITQIALHYYANYEKTKNEKSKSYFLHLAKWLKENFEDNGEFGGWYCNDPLEGSDYHLTDHWLSAMSQGFGLSVMVEAYGLTGDTAYLQISKKVLHSFEMNVAKGGIQSRWGTTVWYDEYPTAPEKHVLNGFVFALAGLYNYHCYTQDPKAKILFDKGIDALHEHLAKFDAGFNSYYSRSVNQQTSHGIASATGVKYQDLHIAQLLWLYAVTKDGFFREWAHEFLKQDFGDAKKYQVPKKFASIKASHTIEPKGYGVSNLNDSIWTYGNYWSSYKYPTELEIEFRRTVNELESFVLVTTGSKLKVSDFKFFVLKNDKWEEVQVKLVDEYLNTTRHHKALVLTYMLANKQDDVEKIKIIFLRNQEKVLALREVNFHYDMREELEDMINYLGYTPCKK